MTADEIEIKESKSEGLDAMIQSQSQSQSQSHSSSKILQPQTQALIVKLQEKQSRFQTILPPTPTPTQGEIEAETLAEEEIEAETLDLDTAFSKVSTERHRLNCEFLSFKYCVKNILKDRDLQRVLDDYFTQHHGPSMLVSILDANGIGEEINNYLSKRRDQYLQLQNSLEKTTTQLLTEMEDFLKLKEKITNKRETKRRINICAYPLAAAFSAFSADAFSAFSAAAAVVAASLYAVKRLQSSH